MIELGGEGQGVSGNALMLVNEHDLRQVVAKHGQFGCNCTFRGRLDWKLITSIVIMDLNRFPPPKRVCPACYV